MGAKSPLLWDKGQVESLLVGSPVVNMVKERLKVGHSNTTLPVTATHVSLLLLAVWLFIVPCQCGIPKLPVTMKAGPGMLPSLCSPDARYAI